MRTSKFVLIILVSLCFFSSSNFFAADRNDFDQISQSELDKLLQNSINRKEGQYLDSYVIKIDWFDGKTTYKIDGADETYLHLKKGSGTILTKWNKVKPWVICDLYWLIHERSAGIYWAMAEFAFNNNLAIQGGEYLAEMVRKWETLQYKADKFMAKKLDIEVPKRGFQIYRLGKSRNRLVTEDQLKGIENAEKIAKRIKDFSKSLKDFSKSKPGSKRDAIYEELKGEIKDVVEMFADAERFEMTKILIEWFANAVKKLKDIVDDKSEERWEQLKQARENALRRIFDINKFPDNPKDAPEDGGFDWVNEAVNDVKSIWTNPELGRIEPQIKIFGESFFDLYSAIDKTQVYVKDYEFNQQMNIIAVDKIGKTVFSTKGLDESEEELETRLNQNYNAYRDMFGYEPLKIEKKLASTAKDHALQMKQTGMLNSTLNGETLTDRLDKAGYNSGMTTDLLSDKGEPSDILREWQTNGAHHRTLLSKAYSKFGTGYVGNYCCMILTEK